MRDDDKERDDEQKDQVKLKPFMFKLLLACAEEECFLCVLLRLRQPSHGT